ncbi:Nn.00g106480.m01.CDS01 [Neocucurbitaria sp. VM-36]
MAGTLEQAKCAMCNHRSTKICSGCKSICYCSKACQKADWPIHKLVCKDYQEFLPTRPSSDHHSVINFPVNEGKPRFAWVRYIDGYSRPYPEDLLHLGCEAVKFHGDGFVEVGLSRLLHRHIEPHHVNLSIPEAAQLCLCCNRDLAPNQSLAKVDHELADLFRGPVLAWATYCKEDRVRKPSDIDLTPMDFRHAVDHLRYLYSECEATFRAVGQKPSVTAVRMNCEGDQHVLGRPPLEHVHEPASILQTVTNVHAPVADIVGLPLIILKAPVAPVWRDRHLHVRTQNLKAPMLNPVHPTTDTGSLIICRKDGKPLHPTHVVALMSYTAAVLAGPGHAGGRCITADMLRLDRMDQISQEDFQRWYHNHLGEYSCQHERVPSPFDIPDDFMSSASKTVKEEE